MKVQIALTSLVAVGASRLDMDEDVPMVQVNEQYLEEAGMDNLEKKLHKMVVNAATGVSKVSDDMLDMLSDIELNMDEILKDTQKEHDVHVDEMNNATARVNKCVEDAEHAHTKDKGINELAETQKLNGDDHVSCRKVEKDKNSTMIDACSAFTSFGESLSPPACSCTIGSNTPVKSEFDWLPDEPNPTNEDCLNQLATWAASNKKEFVRYEEKCKSDTDAWATQKKDCVTKQTKFEKSWCAHATLLQTTCKTQKTCFKDQSEAHALLCKQIAIAVHARKAKFFAAHKVKCYIDMLKAGHNCTEQQAKVYKTNPDAYTNCYANYESCTKLEVDRSHLDIGCKPHKQPMACNPNNVLQPFIGTDAWESDTYSSQADWYPEATTNPVTPACTDLDLEER